MKLQSIAYAIAASQSILSASAGSVRGSVSKKDNVVGEEPHQQQPEVEDNAELNQERELEDQYQEPDLEEDPYRIFPQGIEPEFRTREGDRDRSRPSLFFDGEGEENEVDRTNRIIGGTFVADGDCPWCCSMQDKIGHFCGGSLISPNMVLTAAHCLGGSYDVVVGRNNLDKNNVGQSQPMKREIRHPSYNSGTTNNDFALLELKNPMDMSQGNVELVSINKQSNFPGVGQQVTVLGWGDTVQSDYISKLSDKLMKVDVNMISNEQCGKASGSINGFSDNYFGQISENMMCANVQGGGKDACQGDSGGPLVVKNSQGTIQVGVVSWGIGCASKSFPGVYARISSQYDWIKREVCKNKVAGTPDYFECGGNNGNGNGNGNNGNGNGNGGVAAIAISKPVNNDVAAFEAADNGSGNGSGSNNGSGNGNGNGKWTQIFSENFDNGFGRFVDGGLDARHYDEAKFRKGLIRLQNKGINRADAYTAEGYDVSNFNTCQTRIDFMTIAFEKDGDEFCVEYSGDGQDWDDAKCYNANNYNNKRWWDGEVAPFGVKNLDEVWIRLRCKANNRKDDVLVDHIELECQK